MLPDLQASLLCDDVRQEINGKFILVGLFDGITVQRLPVAMMRMCVVNRWCVGTGVFTQQTRVLAPDGITETLKGKEVQIKLETEEQTATSVEVFVNPQFKQAGTYWIEILLEGQIRMRYPFAIRVNRHKNPDPNEMPQQPPDADF